MFKNRRNHTAAFAGMGVTVLLALTACAEGDGPAGDGNGDSFEGDEVTWLIPVPPGASFDTFARGIAPHLSEELGADILIENQPGASGLVALNEMAQSDPDGTTIALWQMGPIAIAELQEVEQLQFSLTDLSFIGTFADSDHMLFVSEDSDLESFEDIEHGFSFASGELGSLGYTSQQILDRVFSLEADFITGYDDQGERLDAIQRGDADGVIGPVRTYESIGRLGDVNPLVRLANEPHPDFPDVPTALELEGLDDEDRELLETHFDMASLFFTVVGPEGMPDGVLEDMREAFWTVANDEEALSQLEDSGLSLDPENEYITGEELDEFIPDLLDVPDEYQNLADEVAQN